MTSLLHSHEQQAPHLPRRRPRRRRFRIDLAQRGSVRIPHGLSLSLTLLTHALCTRTGWPSAGLRFKPGTDVPALFARLKAAADKDGSGFECFDGKTMPERWHFTGHEVRRGFSRAALVSAL